jgi:sulfur-carrier protein adenylyltransferase/sulfurtransferase
MISSLRCPICKQDLQAKADRGLNVTCDSCKYQVHPAPQQEIDSLKISVQEVIKKKNMNHDFLLIDVRDKNEYETTHIDFAKLIPLHELPTCLESIPKDKEIICHCHYGGRSMTAARFLHQHGFKVKSMEGGIDAWSLLIDSSVRRY